MSSFQKKILKNRYKQLIEELETVYAQIGHTLSSVDKLKLERQAEAIEKEILIVEQKLNQEVSKSSAPNYSDTYSLSDIIQRLDDMEQSITGNLNSLKRGQLLIYKHIPVSEKELLKTILAQVHQNRMEQGEMERTVDAIRRALRHIQSNGLPIFDKEIEDSLAEIYKQVVSDLKLQQQLELSLPVIPLLLNYKIGLSAGVDLGAVWNELKDRAGK